MFRFSVQFPFIKVFLSQFVLSKIPVTKDFNKILCLHKVRRRQAHWRSWTSSWILGTRKIWKILSVFLFSYNLTIDISVSFCEGNTKRFLISMLGLILTFKTFSSDLDNHWTDFSTFDWFFNFFPWDHV